MDDKKRVDPRELGRRGEQRAAWFYRLRGYRVVDRNVRSRSGEIDLVVRRGKTLVICEVKTRQSLAAGAGHESVDRAKREQLIHLADRYLVQFPDFMIRYDILSLFWTGRRFVIEHFPDAFQPVADPSQPWKWRG
ncbi:MAG TPA: YraN family protein [Thermoanaerobaculia bacterium]